MSKPPRSDRTAEELVRQIADKFPDLQGAPCVSHFTLCLANLLGRPVPMNGQVPVAGGQPVRTGDQTGIVFDVSPEAKAFQRWQKQEFFELEHSFARSWREALTGLDLSAIGDSMRKMGLNWNSVTSLEEASKLAKQASHGNDRKFDRMKLAMLFLDINQENQRRIAERWKGLGYPPLDAYAPYAAYVLGIEIFFQVALSAELIGTRRASNRVDIAYLFYLPFCDVFISSDKLHRRCAPHFLRDKQSFVWGEDLKTSLREINEHFLQLPEEVKEQGVISFASTPPVDGDTLVAQLWDDHVPSWRARESISARHKGPEANAELVARMQELRDAPPVGESVDSDSVDAMVIPRRVRVRKGSWWQVPKTLAEEKPE